MANEEHLAILKKGVEVWNKWRSQIPGVTPDLEKADLSGYRLANVNFANVNLQESYLIEATLIDAELSNSNLSMTWLGRANLTNANLTRARLMLANLSGTKLAGSNLQEADLTGASVIDSDLSGADLTRARLSSTMLIQTNFRNAILKDCFVYGISAWDLDLEGANQCNLQISLTGEPVITVDDLEVAQFIHLLLNNRKLRSVIDSITSKVVLILGRFTSDRKPILDALRMQLRKRNYLPILFDFEKPTSRDLTETVSILAHMARFVIADITDAKSIPQELQRIVPDLPSVPIQPLLLTSQEEYGMFEHFRRFPSVLETVFYETQEKLLSELEATVIAPAEAKVKELRTK